MPKNKVIYWAATGLFCLAMSASAYMYFTSTDIQAVFEHLGFPSYFRVELGIAKILGVLALLLPFVPRSLKNFAYAGFTINTISAAIAHVASGDGMGGAIFPMFMLGILAVSKVFFDKVRAD